MRENAFKQKKKKPGLKFNPGFYSLFSFVLLPIECLYCMWIQKRILYTDGNEQLDAKNCHQLVRCSFFNKPQEQP